MTLETGEFIRRFLIHVLPKGFHRIRHYGLLASGARAENLATMRILLAMAAPAPKRNGCRQDRSTCRRRAGPPLSLLRQPHAHYRDLRGKLPAAQARTGSRWDRHVMSRTVSASIPIAARLCRRFHAGHGGARPGASQRKRSAPQASLLAATQAADLTPLRLLLGIAAPPGTPPRPCRQPFACRWRGQNPHSVVLLRGWCPASRAFLPRRLSDAGRRCPLRGSASAGIRNPSQLETSAICQTLRPRHTALFSGAMALRISNPSIRCWPAAARSPLPARAFQARSASNMAITTAICHRLRPARPLPPNISSGPPIPIRACSRPCKREIFNRAR